MLTDDEKSNLDDLHIKDVEFVDAKSPLNDWQDISELLDFSDKLKSRCDIYADRIILLNTVKIFAIVPITIKIIFGIALGFDIYNILLINTGLALFFYSEFLIRELQKRISTDIRALDTIVNLLRENLTLVTQSCSNLQKIQLKIKLSRFDVKSQINTKISWTEKLERILILLFEMPKLGKFYNSLHRPRTTASIIFLYVIVLITMFLVATSMVTKDSLNNFLNNLLIKRTPPDIHNNY